MPTEPATVADSELDSRRPSPVQIAPLALQSAVSGSPKTMAVCQPAGSRSTPAVSARCHDGWSLRNRTSSSSV